MKRLALIAAALIAAAGCRTTRPANEEPVAALTGPPEQALVQKRDHFEGERAVIRIRTVNGTQTQSAHAQVQVARDGAMLLTVYAPVLNTSAARLYASNGHIVFLNDINKTAWEGSAADLTGTFAFVGANPSALAFLILGLPPHEATSIAYGPSGLQSARLQDAVVAYDPPVFPPQRVVIVRGMQRIEIDHLDDYVSPAPIEPLKVPADYRCCVLPQI